MGIFNFWKSKRRKSLETKRDIIQNNIISVLENAVNNSYDQFRDIGFSKAIDYYLTVAPLAHAIDLRADAFCDIPLVLKNKETDEIITNHPLLDLLDSPNADFTGMEFKKQLSIFYDMTGNVMLEATGRIEKSPLELYVHGPQYYNIEASQKDGFAEEYNYTSFVQSVSYYRNEIDNRFRYYNKYKTSELWHIRNFNPNFSAGDLFGSIPISKIASEVEQFARSSNHNLNLLKNGARLSALLMVENSLSDEQYNRLKSQLNTSYAGDENTGKMLLAESGGGKMDLKEMSQSNRDMDFKENKKGNALEIYNFYKIPLPLISPDHMTLSNFEEARLAFYDEAVIPLTKRLLNELSTFLIPRYDDLEGYTLSFNPQDIIALEYRSNQNMKLKNEIGSFSDNEIRNIGGYGPISGGDSIYKPATLLPIGSTQDSRMVDKSRFIEILKKNDFDKETIDHYVKLYYSN